MLKHIRSRLCILISVFVVCGVVALPAVALAQDPTSDPTSAQYDPGIPGNGSSGVSASQSATGGSGGSGLNGNLGSLPFTGLDLIVVAGVALVLTGTGFALRRLSTPRDPGV